MISGRSPWFQALENTPRINARLGMPNGNEQRLTLQSNYGVSVGCGSLPHCNRDNADRRRSRAISYGKSLRLASSTTPTFRAGTNPI
jgi:hypothetical protein